MRVCVLGGTGFIGSRIVRRLPSSGPEVIALARSEEKGSELARLGVVVRLGDLENRDDLERTLAGADVVVNAAIPSYRVRIGVSRARAIARRHLANIQRILDAAARAGDLPVILAEGTLVWGMIYLTHLVRRSRLTGMSTATHRATTLLRPPRTLLEAIRYFSNIDVCTDYVAKLRWPKGPVCPKCGCVEYSYLTTRRLWKCKAKACKKQYSVKVGTVFEDSPLGLDKWLPAVWLAANSKNGISSHELGRALGITQKSAWFMLHRIRLAMQTGTFEKLSGEVEIDETFIGGKARNMHKHERARKITGTGGKDKTAVLGMIERGGMVRAEVIPDVRRGTIQPRVREQVEPGAAVYTDALRSYSGLEDDYAHETVDHAERYVDGRVHTNAMENFWSLLKRGLHGTYISVEPFHLFRYLDERAFTFNLRDLDDLGRFESVLRTVAGRQLTFAEVTGKAH